MRTIVSMLVLALMPIVSCKKEDPPKAKEDSEKKVEDKKGDDKADKKPKKKQGEDDDKPSKKDDDKDDKKAAKGDDESAQEKAGPRSATPTVVEWNGAPDVEVTRAKKLGCETRMVREWLRVSCRIKDDTGGVPTAVAITKGKTKDVLTYVNKAVTSLIVPFEPGMKDFEAVYSWEDKSEVLTVSWPGGSKRPDPLGVFAQSNIPGVHLDQAPYERLCDCYKKQLSKPACNDMLGGPDPDCDRTYQNDCGMLIACSNFEPGAPPKCLPGHHTGMFFRCYKDCSSASDCKANEECSDEPTGGEGVKVCNAKE